MSVLVIPLVLVALHASPDDPAAPGAAIRGRVRDPGGRAVANTEVRARPLLPPFRGTVIEGRVDAGGRFRLAGLREGPYLVSARAPGYVVGFAEASAGQGNVEVVIVRGGAITGVVVDHSGRPVQGGTIEADLTSGPPAHDRLFSRAASPVTDANGRFRVEGLAEGKYRLQVEAADEAPIGRVGVEVTSGRTTDAGLIRMGAGGVIRGTVAGAGGPVQGATVFARSGGEWRPTHGTRSAVTGPGGGFEIRGMPAGSAWLEATHPRHTPGRARVEVDPAGGPAEVGLVLGDGGRIEGRARRREGMPLRGRVEVSPRSGPGADPLTAVVRADGSYTVEHVPPGKVEVTLFTEDAPSPAGSANREAQVGEGETVTVDLVQREVLLSGRVTRGGVPQAGLHLYASSRRGTMVTMSTTPGAAPAGPPRGAAVTDADGRYEMLVDDPGEVRLRVGSPDGRVQLAERREVVPDLDAHVFDIVLIGVSVSGVVIDGDSQAPVPGAWVSAARRGAKGEDARLGRTGPDGRFDLELGPGEYEVHAHDEPGNRGRLTLSVDEHPVTDVRLALIKRP
jgi:hypothetical protein